MWIAGIPRNIRPLHRQLSLRRAITITERIDLHLLWGPGEIYLKPIPSFLLNHASFCELVSNGDNMQSSYLTASAIDFLHSYCNLIVYESDLAIAQSHKLLPKGVDYAQWTAFARCITKAAQTNKSTPRWVFGELRLSRINFLYRFLPSMSGRYLIRGFFWDVNRYSTFLQANFRWVLTMFLFLSVMLNAFQVALATELGQNTLGFPEVAWRFSIFCQLVIAALIVVVPFALVIAMVINGLPAWRRRHTTHIYSCP